MIIDNKAIPIWGWIAHHRESGGRPIIADPGRAAMLPRTEGWDVFPVCRVDDAADRIAALEAELASLRTDRDGAAEACRMLQEDKARLEQQLTAAQAEVRELQRVQSDVLANLEAPEDMDVISAAHFVAGSLSTAEEALEAAQAEARGLRAELARVRGNRTEAELRQLKHDLETAGISAFMSPEKLPKEEWYSSAAFCRDVVRRARYVVEDMIAALSQPAEQHDPLAVSDRCPECSEPEPECVCGEQPAERESGQEGRE